MFNLSSNNIIFNYAGLILLLCSKLCKYDVAARTLSIWFCSEAGITFIYATNTPVIPHHWCSSRLPCMLNNSQTIVYKATLLSNINFLVLILLVSSSSDGLPIKFIFPVLWWHSNLFYKVVTDAIVSRAQWGHMFLYYHNKGEEKPCSKPVAETNESSSLFAGPFRGAAGICTCSH